MMKVVYDDSTDNKVISDTHNDSLSNLVKGSETILFRCSTVFPFTLFPDTIVVDENKVDIVYSYFFFSKSVFPILIENVSTVEIETGPLFATARFEVVGYEQNPEPIHFLPKKKALEMRKIVMGLVAAKNEGVNIKGHKKQALLNATKKIGQ